MIPIAFVTDHVETLFELGIELREDLEEEGFEFENLEVMPGINDHPKYIEALADQVLGKLDHEIQIDDAIKQDQQSKKVSAQ